MKIFHHCIETKTSAKNAINYVGKTVATFHKRFPQKEIVFQQQQLALTRSHATADQ
jgi:hypothetical protein